MASKLYSSCNAPSIGPKNPQQNIPIISNQKCLINNRLSTAGSHKTIIYNTTYQNYSKPVPRSRSALNKNLKSPSLNSSWSTAFNSSQHRLVRAQSAAPKIAQRGGGGYKSINGSIVDRHADMKAFLQHRQRVLDVKPKVDSCAKSSSKRRRSNSMPSSLPSIIGTSKPKNTKGGFFEIEQRRKLQLENQRLLNKIVNISNRKPIFKVSETASPIRTLK